MQHLVLSLSCKVSAILALSLTLTLIASWRQAPVAAQGAGEINFPNFSSTTGLNLVGNAAPAGDRLRLTAAQGSQTGAAWFATKQVVREGFQTTFQFQISEKGGLPCNGQPGADGFAFVIQNSSATVIGSTGFGVGYNGIANSVAIEFDTWPCNSGEPPQNHLSVHTRGASSNSADQSASIGTTTEIPNFTTGNIHTVKIEYQPGSLKIFADNLPNPLLTVALDLAETLNLDNGRAFIGFTASTGAAFENHDLLNWSFRGGAPPAKRVAIVQNFANQEITQLQSFLTELGHSSQVFDQAGLTFAQLQNFDLIIYDDLSFASGGITNSDVTLFKTAFEAGIPLYLIGDDLAHSAQCCLSEPQATQWSQLIHLNPGGNSGGNGTVTIVEPNHPITNGPFGRVNDFAARIDPDATTRTNTGEVLLGKSGVHDVLIAFEDSQTDTRLVTQNVLAGGTGDAAGLERKKLFQNAVAWLLGVGRPSCLTPSFGSAVNFAAGAGPISVAVEDFNNDGQRDLAVVNRDGNNVSILLGSRGNGNGSGGFGPPTNFAVGTRPQSVAVADFNGDNKLDLAVANFTTNNVSVLAGLGNGSFGPAVNFPVGTGPISLIASDFNSDGRPDLAVANQGSNNVSLLLNEVEGSGFQPVRNFPAGPFPVSLTTGDFNNDENPDVAVAHRDANAVSILLGNKQGSLSAPTNFPVGTNPLSLVAADFNVDGNLDLAAANFTSNNVSLLPGTGTGGFGNAINFNVGPGPVAVTTGDFNNDDKPDLAVANFNSSSVAVLFRTETGFSPPANFSVGTNPLALTTGDFNDDTRVDIVTANFRGNNVSVLLNTCSELAPPPDLTITKSHTGNFAVGVNGTYLITVTNLGPGPTTGPIILSDTLPTGLGFVSGTGTGWSCTANGQLVTCANPGPLAPAAITSLNLVVSVAAVAVPSVTNTARVETLGELNITNNSASDPTTVTALGPVILSINPSVGEAAGGTAVSITGRNFTALGAGAPTVRFGTALATNVRVISDTVITANTPAGTGNVPVTVTNGLGTSNSNVLFTYSATALPLRVSQVTPPQGPEAGGTPVRIFGFGFTGGGNPNAVITNVLFGGLPATNVQVISNTIITAVTPPGTGSVEVAISNNNGTSRLPNGFTYVQRFTSRVEVRWFPPNAPTSFPPPRDVSARVTGSGDSNGVMGLRSAIVKEPAVAVGEERTVIGYNVYRGFSPDFQISTSNRIGSTPANQTTFVDTTVAAAPASGLGVPFYKVTAIYVDPTNPGRTVESQPSAVAAPTLAIMEVNVIEDSQGSTIRIDGVGFSTFRAIVEIDGRQFTRLNFPAQFRLANGTSSRIEILDTTRALIPIGAQVRIRVINPRLSLADADRSTEFFYRRLADAPAANTRRTATRTSRRRR